MKVYTLPVWVVTWIKSATIGFKLVTEDELELCAG
jgi:hypothetical protein